MVSRLLIATAAAAAMLACSAASEPLDRFSVAQANGWAEALAICDLTRFLLEQRNLDADVILARDDRSGQFRAIYGPRFLPPNLLYDADLRHAFFRLERAGEVSRRSVGDARFQLDRPMLRAFRRMRSRDRLFLEEQSRTCSALQADIRARYP